MMYMQVLSKLGDINSSIVLIIATYFTLQLHYATIDH